MADKNLKVRIKHKRDTSSNWTAKNPILLNGEIILVDTAEGDLRAKIGDGKKTYTQLPFTDEIIKGLIPTKVSTLTNDANYITSTEMQSYVNETILNGEW